jgi:hypothetical protein
MIGQFPTPYLDELLYSICARFSERLQYPNKKSVLQELFGTDRCVAVVDLPSHLDQLVKSMPNSSCYSVQKLIERHTMLPYYAPFLNSITVERLRRQLKSSHGSSIHTRSGITASSVRPFQWLRYCPMCANEDRWLFGETYWHRIHQVPGVEVCHKHNLFLVDSAVRIHNAQSRHVFFSAEGNAESTPLRLLGKSDSVHHVLLMLSRNAAWLLQRPTRKSDLPSMRARYVRSLADRGLATYSGRVHAKALLEEFSEQYPQSLLSQLKSVSNEFATGSPIWLLDLVRPTKRAKHPLQHLLLMSFLGQTTQEFFSNSIETHPFPHSPYPCLNRAADHFRKSCIEHCRITFTKDHGKPVGTFACDCGFQYMRTGPDRSTKDQHRIDRIVDFGDTWTDALKRMWCDSDVSLRLMSRRLGVDPLTVKRQAALANLSFPRTAPRSALMKQPCTGTSHMRASPHTKFQTYREVWLTLRARNPAAGPTELRRLAPSTYAWLRRNQLEWLKANVPPTRARFPASHRVNWKLRDQRLSEAAIRASLHLRNLPGPPVKISAARIARTIGQLALIQKHLAKLPETARALARATDTRESFAIRRINYAVELYTREGIVPRRWQLIRRAGLRPEVTADLTVEEAIKAAMHRLSAVSSSQSHSRGKVA